LPCYQYDDDDDDDDDNKPVWPTWAVGALFRGARRTHIDRVCFHIILLSVRSKAILVMGKKAPVACGHIPPSDKEHYFFVKGRM
jgi:hypothetical protein